MTDIKRSILDCNTKFQDRIVNKHNLTDNELQALNLEIDILKFEALIERDSDALKEIKNKLDKCIESLNNHNASLMLKEFLKGY